MSEEEVSQTASLLGKLEPGFLPYPIFQEVARLMALPIVEFIPLRLHKGVVEVLLIDRGPEDPLWPHLLHTPGTVIRATDLNGGGRKNWQAFERIAQDELKGTEIGAPHYVGSIFHQSRRGAEQAQLYWVEVLSEPLVGSYYDTNNLPPKLIVSQVKFISEAAKHFKRHKAKKESPGKD